MTFSVFSNCSTSGYTASGEPGVQVGWHPGILIFPSYNNTNVANQDVIPSGQWNSIKTELSDFDCFNGVQLRIHWALCETSEGVYDFTSLKNYLTEMGLIGSGATRKRGFIMIHIRHSAPSTVQKPTTPEDAMDMVPKYMRPYHATNNPTGDPGGATYGGGQWYFESENANVPGSGGKLICWWNANVRAKAALFAQALGEELNNYLVPDALGNDYCPLEGITISESATGAPHPTFPQPAGVTFGTNWEEKYFEGYYLFETNLLAAFPNRIVGAFTNFTRQAIEVMIDGGEFYTGGTTYPGMRSIGCAIGNPNTLPDERPLNRGPEGAEPPGIYWYYAQYTGQIPITCSWQPPDYRCTALGGTISGGAPVCKIGSTPQNINDLYLYTKNNLHATHLFATRTTDLTYWTDFRNYLTSTGIRNIVTGGLNETPPSCYSSVNTD